MITAFVILMTLYIAACYVRELYLFFRNPNGFDNLPKPKITYGDFGGDEVSTKDRLFFAYPFMIFVGTVVSFGLVWKALHQG